MSEDKRLWAFLDASVLYPAFLRNIPIRLAIDDLYRAFWSRRVQNEWTQAIFRDRPHLPPAPIERTRRMMEASIDDAMVNGYEALIETLTLPDADDRHVLSAAIHCGARIVVTANLRDFPNATLAPRGIEARHPDAFILGLLRDSPSEVLGTMRRLRQGLNRPPMTAAELLIAMRRQGLPASVDALASYVDAL
jgi:PIN domain